MKQKEKGSRDEWFTEAYGVTERELELFRYAAKRETRYKLVIVALIVIAVVIYFAK